VQNAQNQYFVFSGISWSSNYTISI